MIVHGVTNIGSTRPLHLLTGVTPVKPVKRKTILIKHYVLQTLFYKHLRYCVFFFFIQYFFLSSTGHGAGGVRVHGTEFVGQVRGGQRSDRLNGRVRGPRRHGRPDPGAGRP